MSRVMKNNIIVIALLALSVGISHAQSSVDSGRKIFETNCTKCHGSAGDKGRFGAKDLTISRLQIEAAKQIIQNGKNIMPAWGKRLSSSEIDQVIKYIVTLRRRVE